MPLPESCVVRFKGSLVPPTLLGIAAIGLGAWAVLSPNRQDIGKRQGSPDLDRRGCRHSFSACGSSSVS